MLRAEEGHGEMKVRGIRGGVTGGSDIPEHLASAEHLSFLQAIRVAIEVRVIVAKLPRIIELIDRQPTRLAGEQLGDRAMIDCENRSAAGGHDVEGFVPVAVMHFEEIALQPGRIDTRNRHGEEWPGGLLRRRAAGFRALREDSASEQKDSSGQQSGSESEPESRWESAPHGCCSPAVGQPILAADLLFSGCSRLKAVSRGDPRHDCLPTWLPRTIRDMTPIP